LLKNKYLDLYGVYPEFKAGLHAGKVVVTWIGDIKKEIVYHGDVLNTTSRLEAECNRYNQTLLVSEFILIVWNYRPILRQILSMSYN